ncbi:F0F1 ATP synthase subunit B' [Mesobaculum littorinae]|uniref:ATP synthase subunit b n=1 Tax=Mesobaculum littorinae TaxID=2486419 RepID=A0A438AEC7_9RHOB|nr:F0F1 ATP synthase subunit B' [Mesobaculum littorinae]RVV97050.1 F0F1 ATP synthase subunit B' [Mesobaculum littorinae]
MEEETHEVVGHGADAAVTHGGEVVGHGADAAHGSAGIPQLDFSTFPNQIFWLLIALIAIYYVLSRVALPRIAAVLAERQGTITNDLAAAEELKLKAQEAETSYNKALADARSEAQRIAAEAKAEIQSELDAAIAEADQEIAAKSAESETRIGEIRASAMTNVETVAKETAEAIVTAFGGTPDQAAVDQAVDARLKGGAA